MKKVIKKANTEYSLEHGINNWIIFTRTVKTENSNSMKESLSINRDTFEIHCNRTGKETKKYNPYYKICIRIEKIFNLNNINNF